jgi:hypothetical protein
VVKLIAIAAIALAVGFTAGAMYVLSSILEGIRENDC